MNMLYKKVEQKKMLDEIGYACVYKIFCKDENIKDCYVGSTNDIGERIRCHKGNCNNTKRPHYNYRVYKFIRDNGGWENWDYEIIDVLNGITHDELMICERKYIEEIGTLNSYMSWRALGECVGKRNRYNLGYYHKNKKIVECPCGGRYDSNNASKVNSHYFTGIHLKYKYENRKVS